MDKTQKVKLTLGEPAVVVQGPENEKRWGWYQFPSVGRLSNGVIQVAYQIYDDSSAEFGREFPYALSVDNGRTFFKSEKPLEGGLPLPNGDRIRPISRPAFDPKCLTLPDPVSKIFNYSWEWSAFREEDIPDEYSGYTIERLAAGTHEWKMEIKHIRVPDGLRHIADRGVFMHQTIQRMYIAPNGRIFTVTYMLVLNEKGQAEFQTVFFVSDDMGVSFSFLSKIPFCPQPEKDPYWELRQGFDESDVAFMPDGSILCAMRTENGLPQNGSGPLYMCRSTDGGLNWSKPEVFDSFGVWPGFVSLRNGITLIRYGRLGLFIRATADKSGLTWDERIEIMPPRNDIPNESCHENTCGYGGWVTLSDDTALLVYSDFLYPNENGVPVKTILARTINAKYDT